MVTVNCETCGILFNICPSRAEKNKHHTCSLTCGGQLSSKLNSKKIKTICKACNKELFLKKSYFKQTRNPTCSRECAALIRKKNTKGQNNPRSLKISNFDRFFWNKARDLKIRAETKGFSYTIDYKILIDLFNFQKGLCYYSGLPMKLKSSQSKIGADYDVMSVDRLDSKKGYDKDNIVFCLNSLNMLKSNHKMKDLKKVLRAIFLKEKSNFNSKVKRLFIDAQLPYKSIPEDAGYDVFVHRFEDCGSYIKVYTGIAIEPVFGLYFILTPRSSIFKKGLIMHNSLGIIDNLFRGEIVGIFYKTEDYKEIQKGDRLMQLIPQEQHLVDFREVTELSDTVRGTGGFGSSGK